MRRVRPFLHFRFLELIVVKSIRKNLCEGRSTNHNRKWCVLFWCFPFLEHPQNASHDSKKKHRHV